MFFIYESQTEFRVQCARKSVPCGLAIISDNLAGDRRRFIDEKHSTSFSLHSHPPSTLPSRFTLIFHSPSSFRIDPRHHREGFKPIDHALDYSELELAQTLSGTAPFPCICQSSTSLSFFPTLLSLRRFSATIGLFLENTHESIASSSKPSIPTLFNGNVPYYQFSFTRQGNCQEAWNFSSPTLSIDVIEHEK